jgi:hypothetical protein
MPTPRMCIDLVGGSIQDSLRSDSSDENQKRKRPVRLSSLTGAMAACATSPHSAGEPEIGTAMILASRATLERAGRPCQDEWFFTWSLHYGPLEKPIWWQLARISKTILLSQKPPH